MKCVECGKDAFYTYQGNSYCEDHYRKSHQNKYKARYVYLTGILLWLIIWAVLIYGIMDQHLDLNMFHDAGSWWIFVLVPLLGCTIGLLVNMKIWWEPRPFRDYETEVGVIEFVERNVGPLITANSIVMSITFLAYARLFEEFPPVAFAVYEILSISFACLVLPVYWIPSDSPKDLVKLRHVKTLFFFYSIFFLFAALITLALCMISLT